MLRVRISAVKAIMYSAKCSCGVRHQKYVCVDRGSARTGAMRVIYTRCDVSTMQEVSQNSYNIKINLR
jgi:hypothetical protein